ncbi:hypothetical protein ABVT39_021217 [Epinephelus coioides]
MDRLETYLNDSRATQQGSEPPVSASKEHIIVQLKGTLETSKTEPVTKQPNKKARDDRRKRGYQSDGALRMVLRGGKTVRWPTLSEDESDLSDVITPKANFMYPLVTRASGRTQYEPWPFMDMIGLAERLPVLTDGADKWIMALEETTAGMRLALGDIKALLTYVAGKQTTQEMLNEALLGLAVTSNEYNDEDFGTHRNTVWQQLRRQYPERRDPTKLEGETLSENECPSKFLHTFQRRWKEETGEAWNANQTTKSLFKMILKKSNTRRSTTADGVVGLMKMDWPMFSERIAHHVEHYRKEKKKQEEDNKQLATKLMQLQLGELSKLAKNETEKAKIQAPVVMANQAMPQAAQPLPAPQMAEQIPPTDPKTRGYPPANATHYHYYYYPQRAGGNNGSQRPPRGQGRGGPREGPSGQGGWRGGPNFPPGPWPPQQQTYQQATPYQQTGPEQMNTEYPGVNPAALDNLCWGCSQPGHRWRECPVNPWGSPAENWPDTETGHLW